MSLWQLLNQDFSLLVAGFGFTTVAGSVLTARIQRSLWARKVRTDLAQARYAEGTALLDELSRLVGIRYFRLQRYAWALSNPRDYDLDEEKRRYFKVVTEWNSRMWELRNKVRLLVGEAQANSFLDYNDDHRTTPQSLHYQFVEIGVALRSAQASSAGFESLETRVTKLNHYCSDFLERLTTDFLRRATQLRLLEVPPVATSSRGTS